MEGYPGPLDGENAVAKLKEYWASPQGQGQTGDWWLHRKDFMQDLAAAVLDRLPSVSWIDLGQAAAQALEERHVSIQLNDRQAAAVLAQQGWDGAVQPGDGDYWMVVDTNVGFNKMDAAVQMNLAYAVDLSDLGAPTGTLTVTQSNPADGQLPCKQDPTYGSGQYSDMINRCYWDYLRVYTQRQTELLRATPHTVPGEWLLSGQTALAKVSSLPGENHTQTFQTLVVVPFGETLTTAFRYALDPAALHSWLGQTTYRLHIQKQSGARSLPLDLTVRLPEQAERISASPPGALEGNTWRAELMLNQDQDIRLTFYAR